MLWHKTIGAGGGTDVVLITSAQTAAVQTITVPPLALAGDLAVIFCTSVASYPLPVVTGWTTISSTGASLYNLRCLFKVLAAGDLGNTLTVGSPTSVSGYAATNMLVFRARGGSLALANIVSLTAAGDNETKTAQTVNTVPYPAPNLVLSVSSAYRSGWTSAASIYSDTYWNGNFFNTGTDDTKQAIVYEIQNDYNTNRTVNLTDYTKQFQSFHSFAVNFA
jgi:hypothetical protein